MTDKSVKAIDHDAEQLRQRWATNRISTAPCRNGRISRWDSPTCRRWWAFTACSPSRSRRVGPPMFWWYLHRRCRPDVIVCLVFCEVVSQFPISGGLYPWARRLVGKRWAWMAGWIYGWALLARSPPSRPAVRRSSHNSWASRITPIETTAHGAGDDRVSRRPANVSGTRLLARVAMFGFICELIGAIVVGGYLLLFARHQPFNVLFDTFSIRNGSGSYLPAFLASALAAMFCYYGFEACGDVAEETPNASRMIPKAMRMTIYVGGAAAMLVCLASDSRVPT